MPRQPIGAITLHYETAGTGPPLLFIHGLGSSSRDWERQIAAFARRHRVIAVDLRGHGQSDKPPGPYSITLFASDITALLIALNATPAHIVGHSLGGMIAFELAVQTPELVQSLVIVNSAPEAPSSTLRERLRLAIAFLQRWLTVRLFGMRKMGELLAVRLFPKPEQADLRRAMIERWAANDRRAYMAATRALLGWSVADRLAAIACPTLVIAAEEDYTSIDFKAAYVAKMPNAELVTIKDSRHFTPVDQTEAFNTALFSFLERQRLPETARVIEG